jgi:hypothetical protein
MLPFINYYAECRHLLIIMLNVIMLNVVTPKKHPNILTKSPWEKKNETEYSIMLLLMDFLTRDLLIIKNWIP